MGACASRPKDFDSDLKPLPAAEDATIPNKAQGENDGNGGESETKKEEPLVDLSEPVQEVMTKGEEPSAESKTADETEEEKKEVKDGDDDGKPKEEAAAATPTAEDKSDAPLVTL
ncbi:hypothetical protein U1Q18_004878 [Sarracenia purpurea var. burkii]